MSDLARGNHSNTNSPYFESAPEPTEDELLDFVELRHPISVAKHFFDNCDDNGLQYLELKLCEFPQDVRDQAVVDYLNDNRDSIEDSFYRS